MNTDNFTIKYLTHPNFLFFVFLLYSVAGVLIYKDGGDKTYSHFWFYHFCLFINVIIISNTISNIYKRIISLIEDLNLYFINQKDRQKAKGIINLAYSNKLNIFFGGLFSLFVLSEFVYLRIIPLTQVGIYAGLLICYCLFVSAQGLWHVLSFLKLFRYICITDEVNFAISYPKATPILKKCFDLQLYIIKRFIITGLIFVIIYYVIDLSSTTMLRYNPIYYISWSICFFVIIFSIPLLLYYPKKLISYRINKLNYISEKYFLEFESSLQNKIKSNSLDTPTILKVANIQTIICNLNNSPQAPLNGFKLSIILNVITIIVFVLTLPDNISKFIKFFP